jgi:hypothetical protein
LRMISNLRTDIRSPDGRIIRQERRRCLCAESRWSARRLRLTFLTGTMRR